MEDRDFSRLLNFNSTRKKQRKEKKHLKKIVKRAFSAHKKVEDVIKTEFASRKAKVAKEKPKKKKKDKSLHSQVKSFRQEAHDVRMKRLAEEVDEDEKEIRRLARKLGYNKRKSKVMPEVFAKEGMDGLWEVCEDEKRAELAKSEKEDLAKISTKDVDIGGVNLAESDDEVERPPQKKVRKLLNNLENDLAALDDSDGDMSEDFDELEDEDEDDVELEGGDVEEGVEDDEGSSTSPRFVEDIYGRRVDARTGKVVDGTDASRALRKLKELEQGEEITKEKRFELTKAIRSMLNRLNEGTLVHSVNTLTDIFNTNSRNDVKQLFYEVFAKSVQTPFSLTDRFLIEYSAFLSLVHALLSVELSGFLVEKFTLDLLKLLSEADKEDGQAKPLKNITIFFAHLYNFKVVKHTYLIELMDKLMLTKTPVGFSLLADVFTYAGTGLRKRDANSFSAFISKLQSFIGSLPSTLVEDTRVDFILRDFQDIKNNKIAKFTDKFDSSLLEHYYKVVRGLTKKADKTNEVGFSVDDVVHVEERGRWWVVGSAFNRISLDRPDPQTLSEPKDMKFDQGLLDLAEKLKLKSELRKSIFCTLMSASDVVDAFERSLKLAKSDHQGRELVYIVFVCVMSEKLYNPFYATLLERFCTYRRSFRLTTQFAIWDKVKELATLRKNQRAHLAHLVADLIRLEAVPLAVLKTVNFAMLDDVVSTFLKRIFFRLLVKTADSALEDLFRPVVEPNAKLELFGQGLQLFFEVSLKPEEDFGQSEELPTFQKRLSLVRSMWGRS